MRAAVLCRLSEEDRRGGESDSIALQRTEALRAVGEGGWACAQRHVLVGDGVSGAELRTRRGLPALLAASDRRAFDVVVVRDQPRLSRAEAATSVWLLVELQRKG